MNQINFIQSLFKQENTEQASFAPSPGQSPDLKADPIPEATEEDASFWGNLDGLGAATARIIIERNVSPPLAEKFQLDGLENRGRYYTAKLLALDGRLIDEALVDKQSGGVHFLRHPNH